MPEKSRSLSASLVVVLGALVLLAVVTAAIVFGKSNGTDSDAVKGGLHELRRDEFSAAILDATEKAGSWKFLQVETIDGKNKNVFEGHVTWDGGDDISMEYGAQEQPMLDFRLVDGNWYWFDERAKVRPWIRLTNETSRGLLKGLDAQADPRRVPRMFEEPAAFQVIGAENIGSTIAVHYRVTVSAEHLRESFGVPILGDEGEDKTFDVWLDDQDRLVKLIEPDSLGAVEFSRITVLSDYGADFSIEAPPADKIKDSKAFGLVDPSPSATTAP